ncbi:MAG: class I SAM-dependent methyltransferase [Acidimicrobiia bacterium]|nr:class I SAM-dependent methyltransferase [Acidimicrobiia bacterium]
MWDDLAEWWRGELTTDPAYVDEVDPLFWKVVGDIEDLEVLDIGCGTGRVMELVKGQASRVVGIDSSRELLADAAHFGDVVEGELPSLSEIPTDGFDIAYAVLVLEHLPALAELFTEVVRVVRSGGAFVVVLNHPWSTSPGSAPVVDPIDGEVLWRVGQYLSTGWHDEPVADKHLRFFHRSVGVLLSEAASAGLSMEILHEQGPPATSIERIPLLGLQRHIPRLMGIRWRVGALHSRIDDD